MNKEEIKKTQYDLIREDIDLIDKYKNAQNFGGLLNDMLIHIKSAELRHQNLQSQIDNIRVCCEDELFKPNCDGETHGKHLFARDILSIIDGSDE